MEKRQFKMQPLAQKVSGRSLFPCCLIITHLRYGNSHSLSLGLRPTDQVRSQFHLPLHELLDSRAACYY